MLNLYLKYEITNFVAPSDQGEKAYEALETSLKKLDCDYIDLYLIHWPGVHGLNGSHQENSKKRDESWQQMVKGVKNGLTRNIGVSNYNVHHLTELLANNHGIKPAVNQVSNFIDHIALKLYVMVIAIKTTYTCDCIIIETVVCLHIQSHKFQICLMNFFDIFNQ